MTQLHTHTFRPFRIEDGKCILSPQSEWQKPREWNKAICSRDHRDPQCPCIAIGHDIARPRIKLDCDLFEDFDGPVIELHGWSNPSGRRVAKCSAGCGNSYATMTGHLSGTTCGKCLSPSRWLTFADIRADTFRLIDQLQNCDVLLTTKHPENVRRMWIDVKDMSINGIRNDWLSQHRLSVWLGVQASAQDEFDKWTDELSDLVGNVIPQLPGHSEVKR